MKVQVSKNSLNAATSRLQGAISERSLAQVGLCVRDNQLIVAATDRILAIYSYLECEAEQQGLVFVPARLFSEVVKELPDGPIKLQQELAYLVISAGGTNQFTMKLPLLDEVSWRDAPVLESENSAEISAQGLAYMIEQVQFCVVQDSPRNYGTVAFLHKPATETLRLVGTDGYRLSYCEIAAPMADSFLANGICLSKRALAELYRMCGEGHKTIKISVSHDETAMVAWVANYQIFIRLSSVKYPNYMGVLPSEELTGVLVSRPYIQNVTKRVLLAADKSRALQLSFSDSSLTLNSKTMGSSESRETVPLQDYHGPKIDIAVNGKFLTDVFATTVSENLTLQFNQDSSEDPIVIVPRTEPSNCRSRHVLVPIKQND